jgi:hypothetical protein
LIPKYDFFPCTGTVSNNNNFQKQQQLLGEATTTYTLLEATTNVLLSLASSAMEHLTILHHEKMKEANAKCEAVLQCRQQLRDRFVQLEQHRSDLEAKYSACAELHGNVKADGNDTIKLNVGGVGRSGEAIGVDAVF